MTLRLFHLQFFAVVLLWTIKQSSAVDFTITLNLTKLSSMGEPNIVLGFSGRIYCLPGQESWYVYVVPENAFNSCTTNDNGFIEVGSCSKDYITLDIVKTAIQFDNIPSFENGNTYYFAAYEVSAGSIVSNDPCVDGYKFSFQVVSHLDTTNIAQPSSISAQQSPKMSISASTCISGSIYFTSVSKVTLPAAVELAAITENRSSFQSSPASNAATATSMNAYDSASMRPTITPAVGRNLNETRMADSSNTAIFIGVGIGVLVTMIVIAAIILLVAFVLVIWNRRDNNISNTQSVKLKKIRRNLNQNAEEQYVTSNESRESLGPW